MIANQIREIGWHFGGASPPSNAADGSAFSKISLNTRESATVDPKTRTFWIDNANAMPPDTLEHCIADLVLPCLLSHDGHLVLHAGCVQTQRGALGFIGPSGIGKSTLTAHFHEQGFPILSDDTICIRPDADGFVAESHAPGLRLFPDSLRHTLPDMRDTRSVAHYFDKRRVEVANGVTQAPLLALFQLAHSKEDQIRLYRLTQSAACMAIIANSFSLDQQDPTEMKARFMRAADLARTVPVFDLFYPRSYDRLPCVRNKLLDFAFTITSNATEGSSP